MVVKFYVLHLTQCRLLTPYFFRLSMCHSVVVSLWDVTEPLYIEVLRSDGPQKRLADVDLSHLKSYWVFHTISIAALGHSKSLWAIYFVSSHPKSSWVIKTSYVRGPPIQNPIYCDSVVTTTTGAYSFMLKYSKITLWFKWPYVRKMDEGNRNGWTGNG